MADKPKIVGWSWFDMGHTRRPIYGAREIRRGKNKGKWEIIIRKGVKTFKKVIVPARYVHLQIAEKKEYTYDNPCPNCGLWLFHDEAKCKRISK